MNAAEAQVVPAPQVDSTIASSNASMSGSIGGSIDASSDPLAGALVLGILGGVIGLTASSNGAVILLTTLLGAIVGFVFAYRED